MNGYPLRVVCNQERVLMAHLGYSYHRHPQIEFNYSLFWNEPLLLHDLVETCPNCFLQNNMRNCQHTAIFEEQ